MRLLLKVVVVMVVLGVAGVLGWPYVHAYWKARNQPNWRLAKVERGDLVMVVNSSGTVQPVLRVQVGAVVSGPIKELFKDHRDRVTEGEVMAVIDPRIYEAAVARDEASCATARAEVDRVKALLAQARNDENRALKLREREKERDAQQGNPNPRRTRYISDAEMDRLHYNRLSLEAQLAVAEAQVRQAEGNLKNSKASLSYTDIRSPVDGIVIDRKIDRGQSLAAQFQTPELFVVAPEMDKRMFVFASVDEADIGYIRLAEECESPVHFTVDAYPDDLFEGRIIEVRMNPTTLQNVVTYTVVVEAPNPEMKLLPGMTAKVSFQIEKRQNVLKVPNAALRFYPKPEQVRPEDREILEGSDQPANPDETATPTDTQRSAMERAELRRKRHRRHVWVVEGDWLRAVEIRTGLSDSQFTELVSGELVEGQEVVTGIRPKTP